MANTEPVPMLELDASVEVVPLVESVPIPDAQRTMEPESLPVLPVLAETPAPRRWTRRRLAGMATLGLALGLSLTACSSSPNVVAETPTGVSSTFDGPSGGGNLPTYGPSLNPSSESSTNIPTTIASSPSQGISPTEVSPTATTSASSDGNYFWVGGLQFAAASGATVRLSQEQPLLGNDGTHSLAELAVESADSKQIVEVGWTVDESINYDDAPHLFVFHWVDGQGTCYNTCDFVQVSNTVAPGDPVAPGQAGEFGIEYSSENGGEWQIAYDGQEVGYFPESEWSGKYTQSGLIQTFGEVNSLDAAPCVQMGDGNYGTSSNAATISDFTLEGTSTAPQLTPYAPKPKYPGGPVPYNYGSAMATGMDYGGPGLC